MIILHTFPGFWGLDSVSPFCQKVASYLRYTKTPYEHRVDNPFRAPKGKLPYIEEGAQMVADSTAILAHLEERHAIDAGLSNADHARAHLVRRLMEESLYFVLLWSRWVEPAGWKATRRVFDDVPAPLRVVVAPMIRRSVEKLTRAQGYGRHTRDEIYALGAADLAALDETLGERLFFLGDAPRTVDMTGHGFLANILRADIDTPLRDAARAFPRLVAYEQRVADALR